MLVLSILFFSVVILLVYSLTKDTGRNTLHARNQAAQFITKAEQKQEENRSLKSVKVLKAG